MIRRLLAALRRKGRRDPQPGDFDAQIRRGEVEVERHKGDPSAKVRIVRR
jgi:hypothetical protein